MLNNELFTEPLVNIDEFIDSPEYLGNYTNNGAKIFPQCREILHKWFNEDDKVVNRYTADRNTGASMTTAIAIAYQLYKLLAFKDVHATFGFPPDNEIGIAFYNTMSEDAKSGCYRYFNDMCCQSPWFLKHGTVHQSMVSVYVPNGKIVIQPASVDFSMLGTQLYVAAFDIQNIDAFTDKDTIKARMLITYSNARARIISRFTLNGTCYGKVFAVEPFLFNVKD